MDIEWNDVRLFLAIAERGSVTEAARQLGVGQPTASRRLGELERRLGYALFTRSVEGTTLTSQGERWLDAARHMAEWAGELAHTADNADAAPRGVVRVTAPPGVAYDFVAPFAARLRENYPEIALHVSSRVEYLDLGRREADLALRTRAPTQRDLVVVASVEHDNDAFVTPAYRARLPKKLALSDIGFIGWAPPFDDLTPNPELRAMIPGFRPVFASDDFIVQRRAAEAGVGAIFLGRIRHRFSGESPLVPLGLELGPHAKSSLFVVCTRSALAVPRIHAVAELLADELRWAARSSKRAARG